MPRSVKMSPEAPGVMVIAADGRELTLRRGLTFNDRPSATAFFQDFAKAQGKRLLINKKKSGGAQYEYVCASRTPPCHFFIKLLKSRSAKSSHFFVSSFLAQHAPDCSGASKLTVRQATAVLLADATGIPNSVAISTALSVKELQKRLKQHSGEVISTRKAYRVRDRVLRLAAGHCVKGLQKLESLLQGFQRKNHDAHVAFESDGKSGTFRRAFLAHPFVARYQRMKGLQAVFGLDTAPLVSMHYRGQLFVLSAKDGNNEIIVLCVAVALQPDVDNWKWFLKNCQQAHVDFSTFIVIANRTDEFLAATDRMNVLSRQCTRHINLKLQEMVKNGATVQVEDLVCRAQAAESEAEFSSYLSMIGLTCPGAEEYLRGLDPRTWALYCVAQQLKLYGWTSTLFAPDETLLSLAPYELMQHYMKKFMNVTYNQAQHATKWVKEGKCFTEYCDKLLAEQREAAKFQVI
ncbi:hypothetical protein CCR75_004029 [Bremia lactucae]|uniref:MULE transposase domain-containing protein n=1 Tax=Bremia lactucae TaxID=4779 RepID=A0A976FNA8_BRELC|nr:hypothetical protein CCR75_004029 [Bremia lactucae]